MARMRDRLAEAVAALVILAASACGSSSAQPTAPTPTPTPAAPFAQRLLFKVTDTHVIGAEERRLNGFTTYSACRTIQNLHTGTANATSLEMTVFGPSGEVLMSEEAGAYERSMGYLAGYSGCRGGLIDRNLSHPFGARYRLRYTVVYDDGVTGVVEGEGTIEVRPIGG